MLAKGHPSGTGCAQQHGLVLQQSSLSLRSLHLRASNGLPQFIIKLLFFVEECPLFWALSRRLDSQRGPRKYWREADEKFPISKGWYSSELFLKREMATRHRGLTR